MRASTAERGDAGRWVPGALALVAAMALALLLSAPAHAGTPTVINLLVNGYAESGVGSTDGETVSPVPIPGWTTSANFTEHAYMATGLFPGTDVSDAIDGGDQFFAGGPGATDENAVETASQEVDISPGAAQIDGRRVRAHLAAALGGFAGQADNARVKATFLDGAGKALDKVTIGPVMPADRESATTLLPRSADVPVPPGTRTVRVLVTARRLEGDYNDGYADNVTLTLSVGDPLPATIGPKGNPLGLPKAHGCVRKLRLRLRHTRGAKIVAATALVNGRRKASKRGSNIKRLTVRHLPHRRFKLRVNARESDGTRLISQRRYRGCRRR